ncbi:GxxExxY protein [Rubritalea tangerina]|uniref:GxxExxY protein n=1 Tax=Rubritalea tangerina TaxID=430798 RepID=A0ABW4ZAL4_9BACT
MRFPKQAYPHSEITEQIIGASMRVHSVLKSGLVEKIYENALCVELAHMGIAYSQQQAFQVHYREQLVGKLVPDLLVASVVIVDTKCVSELNSNHVSQMLSYLSVTGMEVGLVINFRNKSLEFKRIARSDNLGAHMP